MSVRRAQAEISSREFAEWIAYSKINPFGEDRADDRAALMAYRLSQMWVKEPERLDPALFRVTYEPVVKHASGYRLIKDPEPESQQSMYNKLLAFTRAMGGTVIGEDNG